MKKIIFVLAFIAGVVCASCTSNMQRAQELVAEYSQKAEQANVELNVLARDVDLTLEQKAYINESAFAYAYYTVVPLAANWQLMTAPLEYEAKQRMLHAENLRVPLGEPEKAYAAKYTEVATYKVKAFVMNEWIKIHTND